MPTLTTKSAVAKHYGVSITTVQNWCRKGMPGSRGDYHAAEIDRWLTANQSPAAPKKKDAIRSYLRITLVDARDHALAIKAALPEEALRLPCTSDSHMVDPGTVAELLDRIAPTDEEMDSEIDSAMWDCILPGLGWPRDLMQQQPDRAHPGPSAAQFR